MEATTVEMTRKIYRCNAKCKNCGVFVSRAFHKVGKVDANRTRMEDCVTGELLIGHNVSKRTSGGVVLGRWQVTHKCKCGSDFTLMPVFGVNAPDHKCDARCETAKGHNCECACGGANHGRAH